MQWQNSAVRIKQGGRLSQTDRELSGQQFSEEPQKKVLCKSVNKLEGIP
jgi:hypothetical protein